VSREQVGRRLVGEPVDGQVVGQDQLLGMDVKLRSLPEHALGLAPAPLQARVGRRGVVAVQDEGGQGPGGPGRAEMGP